MDFLPLFTTTSFLFPSRIHVSPGSNIKLLIVIQTKKSLNVSRQTNKESKNPVEPISYFIENAKYALDR